MDVGKAIKETREMVNRFCMLINEIEDAKKFLEGVENRTERQDGQLSMIYHLEKYYKDDKVKKHNGGKINAF